jgi:TonB family protein
MAPVFRAATVALAFALLAPHLAASSRLDVRQGLAPPPAPSNPVFVSELTPPQPLDVVVPDPPESARASGAVTLSFCVTRDGKVVHIAITRSLSPALDQLSQEAVRAWRFVPAMRAGRAEKSRVEVTFQFSGDRVSVSARHAGADIAIPGLTRSAAPASRNRNESLFREPTMLNPPW